MSRIVIPNNFLQREKLMRDIYEKHLAEGVNSPLANFDVAGFALKMKEARVFHDDAEEKSKQAEDAYEKRDIRVTPSLREVRKWAQFLKQIYKTNPHELGNWGFVVDDSPQPLKWKRVKVKPDAPSQ